jgi:YHS domain-containing protein
MMMKITQRLSLLVAACSFVAACATPPAKISQETPVAEINNQRGLALRGYDPVAYFTDKKPIEGKPDIAYQWKGATYQFATVEHRELFQRDPEHYAPQFGGYCAYAVSLGTTADGDPFQWAVDGDKLFVNNNAIAYALWNKSRSGNIRRGDVNWPLIPKEPLASDAAMTKSADEKASAH